MGELSRTHLNAPRTWQQIPFNKKKSHEKCWITKKKIITNVCWWQMSAFFTWERWDGIHDKKTPNIFIVTRLWKHVKSTALSWISFCWKFCLTALNYSVECESDCSFPALWASGQTSPHRSLEFPKEKKKTNFQSYFNRKVWPAVEEMMADTYRWENMLKNLGSAKQNHPESNVSSRLCVTC